MNPTEAKDFLNSLSPDKGQTASKLLDARYRQAHTILNNLPSDSKWGFIAQVLRDYDSALKDLESREVPDLKEKVKAAILAGMDAAFEHGEHNVACYTDYLKTLPNYEAWRALCAPEDAK